MEIYCFHKNPIHYQQILIDLGSKLNTGLVDWDDFRQKYLSNGGEAYYGAWKLSYLEPMFECFNFWKRRVYISSEDQNTKRSFQMLKEFIQLMQFKTNFWELDKKYSIDALVSTLSHFLN